MARGNKNSRKTKDFLPGKHEVSPFTPARHLHVRLQQKGSCPQPRQPCTASLRALEGTRSVKARPQDKKTQTIQNAAARLPAAPFRTAGGIVSRHFPHTRKQFGLQVLRLSMTLSPPSWGTFALARVLRGKRFAPLRGRTASCRAIPHGRRDSLQAFSSHAQAVWAAGAPTLHDAQPPVLGDIRSRSRFARKTLRSAARPRGFLPRYSARPEG